MVAKVKISTNRSGGSVGGQSETSKLSKVIDNLSNVLQKNFKLQQSGLSGGGGLGILRGLSGLLTGIIGGTAGLGAAVLEKNVQIGGLTNDERQNLTGGEGRYRQFDYDKVNVDGEDFVAKTNVKTGEILELISEEEATRRKILDKTGRINKGLDDQKGMFDQLTENLTNIDETLYLQKENMDEILGLTKQEKEIRQDIIDRLKEQKESLSRSKREIFSDVRQESSLGTAPSVSDYFNVQNSRQLSSNSPFIKR